MFGGDVAFFKQLLDQDTDQRLVAIKQYIGAAHQVIKALLAIPCPVIASVQGAAAGYGMSLACATDMIIADTNTQFIPAYSLLGTSPDGGLSLSLAAAIGHQRAFRALATNTSISAPQAYDWGLVSDVTDNLEQTTQQLANQLAARSSAANHNLKKLLMPALKQELTAQLDKELESFLDCASKEDFIEGVTAFTEKRLPIFGRSITEASNI